MTRIRYPTLCLPLVLAACENPAVLPTAPRPAFSSVAAAGCPAHATFIATDEASLRSAAGAAQPNDTIALSGMIELANFSIGVTTTNLTFTCASPGSGLRAKAGGGVDWLIIVLSAHVTVERLTLDATNTTQGAFAVTNGGSPVDHVTFRNNTVTCVLTVEEGCLSLFGFGAGIVGAVVTDNEIRSNASLRAIDISDVDSLLLARNRVAGVTDKAIIMDRVADVQVLGNSVTCGTFACVFFFDTNSRVLISDNNFTPTGTGTGLFGLVLFGSGDDVRVVRNHFQCAGHQQESCVHMESDPTELVQKVVISENTFDLDNQLAILVIGADDARVQQNTFGGILSAGGTGDPVIFITVTHGRITDNSGECGDACVFGAGGSPGLVLARNQFQTNGSSAGLLLQEGTDRDSVVGNTIATTAPSFEARFGGIRIRDGANAVVTDNIVKGPWANSLALTDLTQADVERNTFQGATQFGVGITTEQSSAPISLSNSLFRSNRITGAGSAGIFAQLACNNSFVGNDLQGNAENVGLFLYPTTGANTYKGNANLVVDSGAFDCDGNGTNDPNIIVGPGIAQHRAPLNSLELAPESQHRIYGVVLK